MTPNEYAIIVAGGKGTRMSEVTQRLPPVAKQFMELNGLPILMHTINAFFTYSSQLKIILVLPEDDFTLWKSLCQKYNFNVPVILQTGGDSRFQSVKNGLKKIEDAHAQSLVAIHDGVRPMVSKEIIAASFHLAAIHKAAVAAVRLKESIRITDQHNTKAVDRSKFRLIQTPQTFQVRLIKEAYEMKEDPSLTDDASVAERAGYTISLFEGSYNNIKITTPEDLIIAEALMKSKTIV